MLKYIRLYIDIPGIDKSLNLDKISKRNDSYFFLLISRNNLFTLSLLDFKDLKKYFSFKLINLSTIQDNFNKKTKLCLNDFFPLYSLFDKLKNGQLISFSPIYSCLRS